MKKLTVTTLLLVCFALTGFSQDTTKTKQVKNPPKATYQVGAAKVKNFKIEKVYKKANKWLTTNSFDEKELLELKAAIEKAISEELVKTK
jgi:Holliday junction resolvase-like predicted endonuclease